MSRRAEPLRDAIAGLLAWWILAASPVVAEDIASPGTGGVTGTQVRAALHLLGADNTGAGMVFKLGIAVSLTGPDAYLGTLQGNGARLAAAQIAAAGGPDIQLVFEDLKSADPDAGKLAIGKLADAGVPAVLTAYSGDLGAMLPGLEHHKMLGFDGGTGTTDLAQAKPFFWGTRAIMPDDDFAGALQYWSETNPRIKRVSLVYEDQGPANATILANFNQALADQGFSLANSELTAAGTTDYSSILSALRAARPDAIFLFSTGPATGYFMTQFAAAGLATPVIGTDFDPQAAKIAAHAFDNYAFATDWFDAAHPLNSWARLFVDSYGRQFGVAPDTSAANSYEDTFAVWALIRRVLAKAGNINSGDELQNELIANHAIKSIYGGDDTDLDDIMLDTTTHTVIERPLGVYKVKDGIPRQVASFDLGGANFKLAD